MKLNTLVDFTSTISYFLLSNENVATHLRVISCTYSNIHLFNCGPMPNHNFILCLNSRKEIQSGQFGPVIIISLWSLKLAPVLNHIAIGINLRSNLSSLLIIHHGADTDNFNMGVHGLDRTNHKTCFDVCCY